MPSMRVFELAKELNMPARQMIQKLRSAGVPVSGNFHELTEDQVSRVRNLISGKQSVGDKNRIVTGYALLTAGILFWAGNAVVGRAAAGADIPPLTLNFFRWSIALVLFLTIFGRKTWGQRDLLWKHRKFIVIYSVLTIIGFNCTFYSYCR